MLNTKLGRDTGNQENHSETRINYTRDDTSCSSETRGSSLICEGGLSPAEIEVNIELGKRNEE